MTLQSEATATLVLSGELDSFNAPSIIAAVRTALDGQATLVRLDMSSVTFMDSTALSALIDSRAACRSAGARMSVINGSGPVLRIMDVTGTGAMFDEGNPQ